VAFYQGWQQGYRFGEDNYSLP